MIIAPIAGAIITMTAAGAISLVVAPQPLDAIALFTGVLFTTFMGAAMGAIVGWPVTMVLGAATHALLYRAGARGIFAYTFAGAAVGVSVGFLLSGLSQRFDLLAFSAIAGGVIAAIAWLIRRPDRDTNSE